MAKYRALPGQEDRHGEMTGAISINLVMSSLPIAMWSVFIGPLLFDSIGWVVASSVLFAMILPIACLPISRLIWAKISTYMDDSSF